MVTFTAIVYSSADFMLYFSILIYFASQIAEIYAVVCSIICTGFILKLFNGYAAKWTWISMHVNATESQQYDLANVMALFLL